MSGGGGTVLVPEGRHLKVHGLPDVLREHAAVAAVACRGAATVAAALRRCCRRQVAVAPFIAVLHSRRCVAVVATHHRPLLLIPSLVGS